MTTKNDIFKEMFSKLYTNKENRFLMNALMDQQLEYIQPENLKEISNKNLLNLLIPSSVEIKLEDAELMKYLKIISEEELEFSEYFLPYKTPGALCFDLYACIKEPVILYPTGFIKKISTGISVQARNEYLDFGLELNIRSSLGSNGLTLANSTGLIDADYHGLISCLIINNHYENPYTINPGERIAQAKFIPKIRPKCTAKIVREFSTFTERDSNGFGTTGKF